MNDKKVHTETKIYDQAYDYLEVQSTLQSLTKNIFNIIRWNTCIRPKNMSFHFLPVKKKQKSKLI